MQRAMHICKRIVIVAGLAALAPVLTGCADMDMDKLDVFHLNDKKPIPGERRPVFPNGVPGVTQGIPQEYLHPNQPPQDAAMAAPPPQPANNPPPLAPEGPAAAAPPNASRTALVEPHNIVPESDAPKHKPKPKPKAKTEHKPKPKPAQVTVRPSPEQQQQQQQGAPWPNNGQATNDQPWPAAPPAGNFQR